MSLGFGKIPVDQWEKVKAGVREDTVDAGDYFGKMTGFKNFPAERSKKGIGNVNIEFTLTNRNPDKSLHGKKVVYRGFYHPDYDNASTGHQQMTDITATTLAQLVDDACNATPELNEEGVFDQILTLEKVVKSQPEVLFEVTHESRDGREMQSVGRFRPITTG